VCLDSEEAGLRRSLWVLVLSVCVVSCAENNLQQTRAWDAYEACKASGRVPTNVQIDRVEPDGRWWFRAQEGSYGTQQLNGCMQTELALWKPSGALSSQVVSSPRPGDALSKPPVWKLGDEWAFRYQSASTNGTYVWSVDRAEPVDGVLNYVVKTGNGEIFYRESDLAATREMVDGVVVMKNTPPRFQYVWPMFVGQTWEQTVVEEWPVERHMIEHVDSVIVESEETITVPAGTFKAVRIVYRNKKTGAIRYEAWYVPELRHVVRLRENLTSGPRVRELIAFRLR
jgi:hypothetical protein